MGSPCHFALFDLQPGFRLDQDLLASRYRELARHVHPDRFADASEREQRLALEQSASLNEAYRTLKNAPQRARYLLALRGPELPLEVTVQDPGFLMQQMQWREALEDAGSADEVQTLADEVSTQRKARLARVTQLLDVDGNAAQAAQEVRALMFIDRLTDEIDARLERYEDGA